jgi:hypothetical protein
MADAPTLTSEAACIDRCIPKGMAMAVQILLLQELAGNTMTPSELTAAAACYDRCIPKGQQPAVITYLLDQINGGGGTGSQEVFALPGSTSPVAVPASGNGVAYNQDGTVWVFSGGSWNPIIA